MAVVKSLNDPRDYRLVLFVEIIQSEVEDQLIILSWPFSFVLLISDRRNEATYRKWNLTVFLNYTVY